MTSKMIQVAAAAIACLAIGISYTVMRAQETAPTSRSVWDGVYTKEQAARGSSLYDQNCARCHGASLNGNDEAPSLTGPDFLSEWNTLTVGDLFNRILKSMPADAAGSLSPEVTADILSYVLSANNFPAGASELAHRPEMLTQIRIDLTKPTKSN